MVGFEAQATEIEVNSMNDSAIDRRIQFLLSEASSESPFYDQSIRMTMRVISNYVSCGRDVSSSGAKRLARFMSKEAVALKELLNNHREFCSRTINEHPDELSSVWQWMVEETVSLSVAQVLERFRLWPMVVITKDEDAAMRVLRKLTPAERYANIEIMELKDGHWTSKSKNDVFSRGQPVVART